MINSQIEEAFKQNGYVEIQDDQNTAKTFDFLYKYFDELIAFLESNPSWKNKLMVAKENFIRSKNQNYYSTDFFGLYNESKIISKSQIAFYYAKHFHEFIYEKYPQIKQIPEFTNFFDLCNQISQSTLDIFNWAANNLGLEDLFCYENTSRQQVPVLLKVIKYLPSYKAIKPHYDGTAFSLFCDSTDKQSLLLSNYKSQLKIDDFYAPTRKLAKSSSRNSMLLIPGTHLKEFMINPTPHIVATSNKTRYAIIAFAMRPNYEQKNLVFFALPSF